MTEESNLIVIKSSFNKTPGQVYKIAPCPDPKGKMADCVRKVDAHGDMILSETDKQSLSKGKVFLPENEPIVVQHGTTFDLNDPLQSAQWEAIKNSKMIAKERSARDENGNYIIDGGKSIVDHYDNPRGRYGLAELYIERPGKAAETRVSIAKLIHKAESLIFDDTLQHQILICKLFEKDMSHAHPSDVEEYLLTQARKYPEKLIKFYSAEESSIRLLILTAKEKAIIVTKQDGMYYADIKLGSNLDLATERLKADKTMREEIKRETYPELEKKAATKKKEEE
jgi:hypothetical protein